MVHDVVLRCPRCRKDGLVHLAGEVDVFECVYCHYRDELQARAKNSGDGLFGIALFLILSLAVALMAL